MDAGGSPGETTRLQEAVGAAPAGRRCPPRCHRNGLTSHLLMLMPPGCGLGKESMSAGLLTTRPSAPGRAGTAASPSPPREHCEWGQQGEPWDGVTKGCPQDREEAGDAPT